MSMPTKELTNDLVKQVASDSMVYRGMAVDIDSCTDCGVYTLTTSSYCSNPPNVSGWNLGTMEVFRREGHAGNSIVQRITTIGGIIIFRTVYNGNINAWRRVLTEGV